MVSSPASASAAHPRSMAALREPPDSTSVTACAVMRYQESASASHMATFCRRMISATPRAASAARTAA